MQAGILDALPAHARYLSFSFKPGHDPRPGLRALAAHSDGRATVTGLGASLVAALSATVPGLRAFVPPIGPGIALPATPTAVWCWLRGSDRGELFQRGERLAQVLGDAYRLLEAVDGFWHDGGRDLTGYEDGTENPKGDAATQVALVAGAGPGLDGGSFVAVQRWRHDFAAIDAMTAQARDEAVGRRRIDNEEIDDAPASAHVKRTAQENFAPPAFTWRRSMPWVQGGEGGLMFVSFGASFDGFEAQLRRMSGAEDGVCDAIFGMSQPVSGAYFWCPPAGPAGLDLRALGL